MSSVKRPAAIGHRGARGRRPADTIPAFEYALRCGVDVLEMDCVLTADGHIILAHDLYVNPEIHSWPAGEDTEAVEEALFSSLTIEQVRQIDAGKKVPPSFPDRGSYPGTAIPTFEDLAFFVKNRCPQIPLCIEIKYSPLKDDSVSLLEFTTLLVNALVTEGLAGQSMVQCFDLAALEIVKSLDSGIKTLFLIDGRPGGNLEKVNCEYPWLNGYSADDGLMSLLKNDLPVDVAGIYYRSLYPEDESFLVETARLQSLMPVYVWTVNEEAEIRRLVQLGVDGIMSDYPDILTALLGEKS